MESNNNNNNSRDILFKERKDKCQFARWYSTFRRLTFESVIIELPKIVVDYLNSDHFSTETTSFPKYKLDDYEDDIGDDDEQWSTPVGKSKESSMFNKKYYQSYDSDDDTDDSDDDKVEDNNNNNRTNEVKIDPQQLKSFTDKIDEAIKKLGGECVPKLNWSSPKDATFMNIHASLRCSSSSDILLLLKSSDFINHDLAQFDNDIKDLQPDDITPLTLVLRRWANVNIALEFRCFIKDNQLIAISQRDTSAFFDFLPAKKELIQSKIKSFAEQHIINKFNDVSYCFDVCFLDTNLNTVTLMDFNPIHPSTDSLLFDWYELFPEELEHQEIDESVKPLEHFEFRIVESNEGIRPNLSMSSRLPSDLVNMQSTSEINEMLSKFKDHKI
ncbi:cell division cycle protein 123 [Heterostelium album PN500]|uniref:Cell division cycle protein 123 n=1 Tax=Heterostelium pallidum (strain ATCC 26659 / Pp 5 / PN500) TaxID=670386 RepID=D3B7V8_HETP5|nr:cell division cycle protein 123 [Heterostelium album PN500]EFA82851.1 cell division cycle protein 123 [Heterostelium album PN500]|eukprot:XP_020434968.1 cell division cycle protein 123 [Heterostelium album PN500]